MYDLAVSSGTSPFDGAYSGMFSVYLLEMTPSTHQLCPNWYFISDMTQSCSGTITVRRARLTSSKLFN